jgi:flagellar hook-associated protein 1 FlgK
MGALSAASGLTQAIDKMLRSFQATERAISTVSLNVANVSTPGYVRQIPIVQPDSIVSSGHSGQKGVSRRVELLEREIRARQQTASAAGQSRVLAERLESALPLESGALSSQLDQLFRAFSELSVNPNQDAPRRNVLDQAERVASGFRDLAGALRRERTTTDAELRQAVSSVNDLTSRLVRLNQSARQLGAESDPQVEAERYHLLEQLSEYLEINAVSQPDGSMTVFGGNGEPLVLADISYPLQLAASSGGVEILDHRGIDIQESLRGGKLTALVEHRNQRLPQIHDQIDGLASGLATQINAQWLAGTGRTGNPPAAALFRWTAGDEALTLAVNTQSLDDVPAASALAPGGNGNAIALAQLRESPIMGTSNATDAYADISAQIGRSVTRARDEEALEQAVLAESKALRERISGVSLDEEAAEMIKLQTAYEASAKMLRTLDEMTRVVLDMFR